MVNKVKNYKYGEEEDTDTKKKLLLLFKTPDWKGQRHYYHYTEEGNFEIDFENKILSQKTSMEIKCWERQKCTEIHKHIIY